MRPTSMLTAFLIFCFAGSSLYAQTLLSSFPVEKPPAKEGYYFPYEDENGCAQILLFPTRFDLRVLYLDKDLNLLDDVKVLQEKGDLKAFEIVGFINQKRSLILIVQYAGQYRYSSIIYDKRARTMKKTELNMPLRSSSLRAAPVYIDGAFTSIQIHRRDSEVVVYRTRDGYELESDTFSVPVDDLHTDMESPDTDLLFMITAETGNSLFSNIPKNKIYLYGNTLHFSLEERKEGLVKHISIDLAAKSQQYTEYQLPRYNQEEAILKANSLVFEDLILLAAYQKEGLMLEIHELGEGGLMQAYDFPTDLEMDSYFLAANTERNNGTKLEDKRLLHPFLKKSLLLSVEPTAEGDLWLIVGSVPQMSPAAQTALYLSVSVAAAFLGASIDPNIGNIVSIDPAGAIESGGFLLLDLSDRYGKFVYRVGSINAADLSLKSQVELGIDETEVPEESAVPLSPYDKMLEYLYNEEKTYRETANMQVLFPYRDGIVKGYATRKKEFRMYYFE